MTLKIIFTGRVQGVGFRYRTAQLAREFGVGGTVRNLLDGTVELIVDGSDQEVEAFISRLEQAMSGYIRDAKRQEIASSEHFTSFEIRH